MRDVISKFERTINRINIVYGLQFPVGLTTLIVIILWFIQPEYFQSGSLRLYAGMIIVVGIISAIHSRFSETLSTRQLGYIYACYHMSLIIFTGFVAPFLSPYEFLWIVLAVGMDLLFGEKRMRITLFVYAATLVIAFFQTNQQMSVELFFRIFIQYIGVIFISLQVSKYRVVSDEERRVLDTTSQESNFERQRLLSLINSMGEAVIATNIKGKILIYNAATLNLLDTNQSLEGKNIDTILNLKNTKSRRVKLFSLLREDEHKLGITSSDYVHEFKPHDGISLYINATPIKLNFNEGAENGYIIIMRDITKEKSLEEERDEFISVVSHELRTPVAIAEGNISNAIFMGDRHNSPTVVKDSLAQAHERIVFLANMINDLATLSRAERTDVELELSEVNPADLIEAIGRDYEQSATDKGIKLTISVARDIRPLTTSELYLREVLQNFVTNAIKYTKKGSVIAHVRTNKDGDAVFSIADTGIGLSKADQKRVFDKFFRSEDFRTRESNGTGLGLYVTAKLAHRLNAKIELESELNKGSTFTITVPSLGSSR